MIVIGTQKEINKYFDDEEHVSQSQVKQLLKGFDFFMHNQKQEQELFYEEKGHFIIGSAVDLILTGKEGEFDKQYHISQIEKKPSDVEMSIINEVLENVAPTEEALKLIKPLNEYGTSILDAADNHNWQKRWKDETRIKKIVDVGEEYWSDLINSYGKQVISVEEYNLIMEIVESFRNHPITQPLFDREKYKDNDDITIFYQLPIYFEIDGIKRKALIDELILTKIDENKYTISIYDIKTTSDFVINFPKSFKRFRYDIQYGWYYDAVSEWVKQNFDLRKVDVEIRPMVFIVESTKNPGNPVIFVPEINTLITSKEGMPELVIQGEYKGIKVNREIGKKIKGYKELINDWKYYENQGWMVDKRIADSNNIINFNWNGIIE